MCWNSKSAKALRVLGIAGVLMMLSACTHVTQDVYATFKHNFKTVPDTELTKEEINELPYTAIYARDGKQPQAVLILGFVDQVGGVSRYSFISRGRQTLVMEHGRIVRTDGLAVQLIDVTNRSNDPLRCIVTQPENCELTWERDMDVREGQNRFTDVAYSEFQRGSAQTLSLPDGDAETVHIIEQGQFRHSDKTFTNEFWLESDGHVVKSIQTITPNHPQIELTQVKWVGR